MLVPLACFWPQVPFLSQVLFALPGRSWRWTRQTGWCRQTRRRQPEGACRKAWTFCRNLKKIMTEDHRWINSGFEGQKSWPRSQTVGLSPGYFLSWPGNLDYQALFYARCVIRSFFSNDSIIDCPGFEPAVSRPRDSYAKTTMQLPWHS